MELKSIDVSNDEIYSQQEREQILEKIKSFYENKLAEKDKEIQLAIINEQLKSDLYLGQIDELKKEIEELIKECD